MLKEFTKNDMKKYLIELDKYYSLGLQEVSDLEYDELCIKYKKIVSKEENINEKDVIIPKWENNFSSLLSTYNQEDVFSFIEKIGNEEEFIIQPKLDGISIFLIYKEYKFFKAYTRGGNNMRDVSSFFVKNNLIPMVSQYKSLELRGELCIGRQSYSKYVIKQEKSFVSGRNFLAGILSRKNFDVKNLDIKIVVFEEKNRNILFESQINNLKEFDTIETKKYSEKLISLDIQKSFEKTYSNFNCDGIVVKVDSKLKQDELGFTSNHPKWAIAYKKTSQESFSTIESIELTVGKTGKISVLGNVKEKNIFNRKIKKILFYNINIFKKFNIRQGDRVFFRFKGDSIAIFERSETMDISKNLLTIPTNCPSCNSLIERVGNLDFCLNENCFSNLIMKIISSAKIFDIKNLGKKTAEIFVKKKYTNIYKIMNLSFEEMYLIIQKDKITTNLYNEIKKAISKLTLQNIILSLNIPIMTEKASKILDSNIKDFFELEYLIFHNPKYIQTLLGNKTKTFNKIQDFFYSRETEISDLKKLLI